MTIFERLSRFGPRAFAYGVDFHFIGDRSGCSSEQVLVSGQGRSDLRQAVFDDFPSRSNLGGLVLAL